MSCAFIRRVVHISRCGALHPFRRMPVMVPRIGRPRDSAFLVLSSRHRVPFHCSAREGFRAWATAMHRRDATLGAFAAEDLRQNIRQMRHRLHAPERLSSGTVAAGGNVSHVPRQAIKVAAIIVSALAAAGGLSAAGPAAHAAATTSSPWSQTDYNAAQSRANLAETILTRANVAQTVHLRVITIRL